MGSMNDSCLPMLACSPEHLSEIGYIEGSAPEAINGLALIRHYHKSVPVRKSHVTRQHSLNLRPETHRQVRGESFYVFLTSGLH